MVKSKKKLTRALGLVLALVMLVGLYLPVTSLAAVVTDWAVSGAALNIYLEKGQTADAAFSGASAGEAITGVNWLSAQTAASVLLKSAPAPTATGASVTFTGLATGKTNAGLDFTTATAGNGAQTAANAVVNVVDFGWATNLTVPVGGSAALCAPPDDTALDTALGSAAYTYAYALTSGEGNVATIASNGTITGVAPGTAKVKVTLKVGGADTLSSEKTFTVAGSPTAPGVTLEKEKYITAAVATPITAKVSIVEGAGAISYAFDSTYVASVSGVAGTADNGKIPYTLTITPNTISTEGTTITVKQGTASANITLQLVALNNDAGAGTAVTSAKSVVMIGESTTLASKLKGAAGTAVKYVPSKGAVSGSTFTASSAGASTIGLEVTKPGYEGKAVFATAATINVVGFSLSKSSSSIAVAGTDTVVVTPDAANAGVSAATPFTVYTNAPAVATASFAGGTVTITGNSAGTATVTVYIMDTADKIISSKTINVTVVALPTDNSVYTIVPTDTTLEGAGSTATIKVYKGQTAQTVTTNFVMESSNLAVATVAGDVVTAVAAGDATITIKDVPGGSIIPKVLGTVKVKVIEPATSLSIALKTAGTDKDVLAVGASSIVKPTVTPGAATGGITYTSSNDKVITATKITAGADANNCTVKAIGVGTAVLTAKVGNFTETMTFNVVELKSAVDEINFVGIDTVGKEVKFSYNPEIEGATFAVGAAPAWSSTVAAGGFGVTVSGTTMTVKNNSVPLGSYTMRVSATVGSTTITKDIKVNVVQKLTKIEIADITLEVGKTATPVVKFTPDKDVNKNLDWAVYGSAATIDDKGVVKGVKAGEATLVGTAKDGSGVKGQATITVKDASAVIKLPTYKTVAVGRTIKIAYTTTPAGAAVTWRTNKPNIVSIDANGVVTGKAAGTCYIYAKSGSYEAFCQIRSVGVVINETSKTLSVGDDWFLRGKSNPASTGDQSVSFYSNNTKVCTVDKDTGEIIAVGKGTCKITAKANVATAAWQQCVITVK